MSKTIWAVLAVVFWAGAGSGTCLAQSTFQNLGFESIHNIPVFDPPEGHPWTMPVTNALPGWSAYFGTNQRTQIYFNETALGSTWIAVVDSNCSPPMGIIAGNYSVVLQGGFTAPYAAISQKGLVPASAQSLRFKAQHLAMPEIEGALVVSLGGVSLPIFSLSSGPNYTLFGCDVSNFANQTEELSISAINPYSWWLIDSISFSAEAIPEPSTVSLLALGALFLGWRLRRSSAS
jgi:hypothetical protein